MCHNKKQREQFQEFVIDTQPSDDQQIEYLRNQFPNFHIDYIFQLIEILNSRRHRQQPNFENLTNFVRRRNRNIKRQRMNIANLQGPPANNQVGHQAGNQGGGNPGGNPAPPEMQPAVAPQSAMVFVDDPFKGNINPGTSDGAKLYMKATATIDEDDKFDINIDNAQKSLDHMTRDTNTFGWGVLVRTIQVDANTVKSVLKDHKDITKADKHIKHGATVQLIFKLTYRTIMISS